MKKSFWIFMILSMPLCLMAQEKTKQKEVGLVFNDLNNFGLTYKTGTNKAMWRFNTLLITGDKEKNESDDHERNYNSFGFNMQLGREYRKVIVENLELRYGLDLSFRYHHSKDENTYNSGPDTDQLRKSTSYEPGINLVFGFNYVIKEKLVIGAEILPYFRYNFGTMTIKYDYIDEETTRDTSGFSYGLSTTSVLLSLAYRF